MQVEKVTEVLKPTIISFKHKDDTDLFGLGIQDEASATRDSSEEQEGKMKNTPGKKKLVSKITSYSSFRERKQTGV